MAIVKIECGNEKYGDDNGFTTYIIYDNDG